MISKIAKKNCIKINISGLDACPSFVFNDQNKWLEYKTYITQELLKQKVLGANTTYVSISHTDDVIKLYEDRLNKIFIKIDKIKKAGNDIKHLLEGPVSHSTFKRLN